MNLINELRILAEDLRVNGYNRCSTVVSQAADELASLERYRTAYNEWTDKTEWMQKSLPAKYLGMHRADVLKDMISELFDRLEAAEKAVNEAYQRGHETGQEEIAAERDTLRDRIAEMEEQEPIAKVRIHKAGGNAGLAWSVAPLNDFDSPPLMRDGDRLYALPGAQPAPSFADAYQGAMEEVAIWKKRALEAEELNRKFIAEINGPTYMGEPAPSVPDGVAEALQRLIENGAVLGPASSEDALLVARYRQRLLACAPSVPDGWTLAPIEPTFEMLVAGEDMLVPTYTDTPVSVPFDVYRAMLAAAPEAKP